MTEHVDTTDAPSTARERTPYSAFVLGCHLAVVAAVVLALVALGFQAEYTIVAVGRGMSPVAFSLFPLSAAIGLVALPFLADHYGVPSRKSVGQSQRLGGVGGAPDADTPAGSGRAPRKSTVYGLLVLAGLLLAAVVVVFVAVALSA